MDYRNLLKQELEKLKNINLSELDSARGRVLTYLEEIFNKKHTLYKQVLYLGSMKSGYNISDIEKLKNIVQTAIDLIE